MIQSIEIKSGICVTFTLENGLEVSVANTRDVPGPITYATFGTFLEDGTQVGDYTASRPLSTLAEYIQERASWRVLPRVVDANNHIIQ